MAIAIGSARLDQCEETIELWRRAGLTVPHNPPRVDFEFALGKPGSDVLIGEIDGRIVASVMVGHDGHRGWVYYVAVDPDCQKLGYGAEMMRAAEMWLKVRGVRKIQLMVRDSNAVAQGFYKAIGYEVNPVAVLSKWLI
jgi:ribosomal protein S18 acetylase RimI-like enzyme